MSSLFLSIGTVGILIAGVEYLLWRLFRSRIQGLVFPRYADQSFFRFFTFQKMRLVALFHTLSLISIFALLALFTW